MTTEEFMNWMIRWGNFKARHSSNFPKTIEAKKNKELEGKHKNKRCFIIGNGESIKNQDLSLLADEIVFVTNRFCLYSKGYLDVNPDYYVMADALHFKEDYNSDLVREIDNIRSYNKRPVFILPYPARKVIQEQLKWDMWAAVYYYDGSMAFVDGFEKKYDITRVVPSPQCVVQVAMLVASYMGVKEIYLLGIEQTDIFDFLAARLGKPPVRYAYEIKSKEDLNLYAKAMQATSLEITLRGYARIFEMYKLVYEYCCRQGIKVYNCTPKTLIDSIPYKEYKSLF